MKPRSVVCGCGSPSRLPSVLAVTPGAQGLLLETHWEARTRPKAAGLPAANPRYPAPPPPAENVRRRVLHAAGSPPPGAWTEVGRSRRTDRGCGSVHVGLRSPATPGPGGLSCAWQGTPRGTGTPRGLERIPGDGYAARAGRCHREPTTRVGAWGALLETPPHTLGTGVSHPA